MNTETPDISAEWLDIYMEATVHNKTKVEKAQAALTEAEVERRIDAVISLRYGATKTEVANLLGISRPTLDAWIKLVKSTPDETAQVERTLEVNRRRVERERQRRKAS